MKKLLRTSVLVLAFLVLASVSVLMCACGTKNEEKTFACEFKMVQNGEAQELLVSWDTAEELSEVNIVVRHGNDVVGNYTINDQAVLQQNKTTVYAYYGKHTVEVTAKTKNNKISQDTKEVMLSAEEYNFAPLSGSMPVLLFTLMSIDEQGLPDVFSREVPTFVWFERVGAWDWKQLPENIYPLPTATEEEYTTRVSTTEIIFNRTNAYIKELASINPDSKFNLLINDFDAGQFLNIIVANQLKNYTCTFLSDGSHSYNMINKTFNVENATEKYEQMLESYQETKQQVATRGSYPYAGSGFTVNYWSFQPYIFLLAAEEANTTWVMPRFRKDYHVSLPNDKSNFVENKIFVGGGNNTISSIKEYAIATALTNIQNNPDKEKIETLKTLYKFNDDMFAKANEEGKKVMMILGSHATDTPEANFVEYVNFVKQYYGDEYVYYYKGHPNSPTNQYPTRAQLISDLGLIDIESTIAAELILFFFPDISMSGYASSTFDSIVEQEMACVYFGTTKAAALADANIKNGAMFDAYIAPIASHGSTYSEYATEEGHVYYVVEFNDNNAENYNFAIYDSTTNELKYY